MGIALLSEVGPSGLLRRFGRAFFFSDIFQAVSRMISPSHWRSLWHMTTDYTNLLDRARRLIAVQRRILQQQQDGLIEAARVIAALEAKNIDLLYEVNSLATAALVLRADPEADIGDEIEALLQATRDRLAVIEEHMP